MPFLASAQNRSSRVLSTTEPDLVALEQFGPNSPVIALTALTKSGDEVYEGLAKIYNASMNE